MDTPEGRARPEVASYVAYDARIGERFELDSVPARWAPYAQTAWVQRLRTARGEEPSQRPVAQRGDDALVCNVSVSGAGILAPTNARCVVGATVDVTLGPGVEFQATIRRVQPSDELGYAFYGVEYTQSSVGFESWLHSVIEAHRSRRMD
ncbi:MAG: hypothetical protein ACK5O2_03015 [Microthrixaceae bacterium]